MKDTGRISKTINPEIGKILYGENVNESIDNELYYSTIVDQAHVLMLEKCGIIDTASAKAILTLIGELQNNNFAELRDGYAPRGIFLLYENYLIKELGIKIGGILQTGRSRNDLKVATLKLKLRSQMRELISNTIHLQETLLELAGKYQSVIMSAYTHYQPAVPITFGHYLSSIATGLDRDIEALLSNMKDLQVCPLGAAAVGGTSFPINVDTVADLLGFDDSQFNSIDTVASRDYILRILSSISIMETLFSRFVTDLLLWTTYEFGFFTLADEIVGSSSIMPNKRNPFFLEVLQGKSALSQGILISAITAMNGKPYSNSISVGSEGVQGIWKSIENANNMMTILDEFVSKIVPNEDKMLSSVINGYTVATEIANILVREKGMSFREAHNIVGKLVTEAFEHQRPIEAVFSAWLKENNYSVEGNIAIDQVVAKTQYGGGPSKDTVNHCILKLKDNLMNHMKRLDEYKGRWAASNDHLSKEIEKIVNA